MNGEALTGLVGDSKMLDRQKDEIMKEYEDDLYRIQMKHEEGDLEVID